MNISILIPHYKSGKVTAYSISQFLKNSGKHNIKIYISNNSPDDDSVKYLKPFINDVVVVDYPSNMLQSHGIGVNRLAELCDTEYFVTAETDSFPTNETWLDEIEKLINEGYDAGGSFLELSGGMYMHPCGAFYSKKAWKECDDYLKQSPFKIVPNVCNGGDGFDYHLMIPNKFWDKVLDSPQDFFDLSNSYKNVPRETIIERTNHYSSSVCAFHCAMGLANESCNTYGRRNIETEPPIVLFNRLNGLYKRVGYEPGQYFTYWMMAMGKKIAYMPTEIKWLPNREKQQQEYTLMCNGFKHIWAGTAYLDMKDTEYNDVYEFKHNYIESLYNSLPENKKI